MRRLSKLDDPSAVFEGGFNPRPIQGKAAEETSRPKIADAKPQHARAAAIDGGERLEIAILSNDNAALLSGASPDQAVVRREHAPVLDMHRVVPLTPQPLCHDGRQLGVYDKPQARITTVSDICATA